MKLPKTLNIISQDWGVEESSDVARASGCWGTAHFASQKIVLEPKLKADLAAETLLHEILHTCFYYSGMSERMERVKETISEEEIIRGVSNILYQVLKDNKLHFDE
jgi:hypothetical protein